MSNVIFAHPRWDYQSYSDYKRLVELSGYQSCYMDEMDLQSDNTYIFSTPDTYWLNGFPDAKARLINYCFEWYLDVDYSAIPNVEIWCTDKHWSERIDAKYVPMGSHADLNPRPQENCEKVYDVCTLWAKSSGRYHAEDLMNRVNLTCAPNGWGDERHRILSQSRMMVCVHQMRDENMKPVAPTAAPQRWALAAAYKLPIVSETLADAGMLADVTIQTDLESVGEVAASWKRTENAGKLRAKGDALHRLLCHDYTFRKGIESNL